MRTRGQAGRTIVLLTAALAALALLPAGASAQPARPTVTTDPATGITQGGARLNGSVISNERATTAYFEYGTTRAFGARTPPIALGNGTRRVPVALDVGGPDRPPATTSGSPPRTSAAPVAEPPGRSARSDSRWASPSPRAGTPCARAARR